MKTAYYTFTVWEEDRPMAAGYDGAADCPRRAVLTRRPGPVSAPEGDKIIDLPVWREASPEPPGEETLDGEAWADKPDIPAPRERGQRRAMLAAELASTLSVAAAALAIILRVLAF